MISQISGQIIAKQPPELVIDVAGVGYEILASMNTFYQLPGVGEKTTLFTALIVREDSHTLYGFNSKSERQLFKTLIKVNGVGPKMAITMLSAIEPDAFVQCIADQDIATLTKIPGIGKKTAERLAIEMRDKIHDWSNSAATITKPGTILEIKPSAKQDAISALIALGYKPADANKAINKVATEELSSEEIIRLALKNL